MEVDKFDGAFFVRAAALDGLAEVGLVVGESDADLLAEVGVSVGKFDGLSVVGTFVGALDGVSEVRMSVGNNFDGKLDGLAVVVGTFVGALDGVLKVGMSVGISEDGNLVGRRLAAVGTPFFVGALDGFAVVVPRMTVGTSDGNFDGLAVDGTFVGALDGFAEVVVSVGKFDGLAMDGTFVGALDGFAEVVVSVGKFVGLAEVGEPVGKLEGTVVGVGAALNGMADVLFGLCVGKSEDDGLLAEAGVPVGKSDELELYVVGSMFVGALVRLAAAPLDVVRL